MKLRFPIIGLILISILTCAQDKNSTNTKNTHEIIVPDLDIPWGFTFLPDGAILITEKAGQLIHFKNGKKTEISGLPEIYVRGQGGFMDVTLHPDYKNNNLIYFSYASSDGEGDGGNTTIASAKYSDMTLTNWKVLYKAEPNSTRGQHFGSRLQFDKNGHLL